METNRPTFCVAVISDLVGQRDSVFASASTYEIRIAHVQEQ